MNDPIGGRWIDGRPGDDLGIYQRHGHTGRRDYLNSLADEYGQPRRTVYALATVLGPNEDFDGLVTSLQDMEDEGGDL